MHTLYNKRIKQLKDNRIKGFSLVELIIVIAIMAILSGVLAPALIKYVRKSRRVADIEQARRIKDTVQYLLLDTSNPNMVWTGNSGETVFVLGFSWNYTAHMPNPNVPNDNWSMRDYLFHELGGVPVSKTNKNLYYTVGIDNEFESGSGGTKVIKVWLKEDPWNDTGIIYELYPDSSEFLSMVN
ncbi:MAG: type IV pilin protein [Coprococcus sp.]